MVIVKFLNSWNIVQKTEKRFHWAPLKFHRWPDAVRRHTHFQVDNEGAWWHRYDFPSEFHLMASVFRMALGYGQIEEKLNDEPTLSGRREKHTKGLNIAKKRNHRYATASSVIKNEISTVRFTWHKQSSRIQILDSVLNAFYVYHSCLHRCHSLDPAYLLREF